MKERLLLEALENGAPLNMAIRRAARLFDLTFLNSSETSQHKNHRFTYRMKN